MNFASNFQIVALSSLLAAASAGNLGHAVSSQRIVRHDEGHYAPLAPYNTAAYYEAPLHYAAPLEVSPIAYAGPVAYDGHYDDGHYEHVSV